MLRVVTFWLGFVGDKERVPPSVRHVGCRRGDLRFFLGSRQTHGVLPWRGEDQRRCVIAKYAPAAVALPAGHALVPDCARTVERSVARL